MQEKFEFKGDWDTKIVLKEFSQLNYSYYQRYDQDVDNGIFNMTIEDEQNCNPYPEEEQLAAINYLIANQERILNSVFQYAVNVVYPKYKKFQDPEEYPESYPELNNPEDLQKLVGVNEIMITRYKKEGYAYIVLGFNTCLDDHGLYIYYHKDRPLGDSQLGEMDYEEVYSDGSNAVYKESYEKYGDAPSKYGLHIPDPKLGKLKPWQGSVNEYRIKALLDNEPELLKKIVDEKVINTNLQLNRNTMFELCVNQRHFGLIEYMINNGSEFDNSLIFCVNPKFDLELLEFLIKLGIDINYPIYKNRKKGQTTILFHEIQKIARFLSRDKTKIEAQKDVIKRIIQFGGDLNNCDGQGSYYIELLKDHYNIDYIERIDIENIIIELSKG